MAIKILLADDSLTIQKVVELTFSDAETRLMAVGSGDRAVQALDEFAPDIVLADVVMPGLTGYDVCDTVKHRHGGSFVPVVLLTGTFEPFDRSRAERVGSDAIVTKPFDSHALQGLVRDLVAKARSARAEAEAEAALAPPPAPEPPATTILSAADLAAAFPPPAERLQDTASTQALPALDLGDAFGEPSAPPVPEASYATQAMRIPSAEELRLAAEEEGLLAPPPPPAFVEERPPLVEPPSPFEMDEPPAASAPAFLVEPAFVPPPPPPPPAFYEPEPPPAPFDTEPETATGPEPVLVEPAFVPPPPPPPPAFYEPEPALVEPPPPPAFFGLETGPVAAAEPETPSFLVEVVEGQVTEPLPPLGPPPSESRAPETEIEPFFAEETPEAPVSEPPVVETPFEVIPEAEIAAASEEIEVEVEAEAAAEAENDVLERPAEEPVAVVETAAEPEAAEPFPEMDLPAPGEEAAPWDEGVVEVPPPPPELLGAVPDAEGVEPVPRDIEADLEAFEASGRVTRRPEIWERHAALIGEEPPTDIGLPEEPAEEPSEEPSEEPAAPAPEETGPSAEELEEIAAAARLEDLSALIPPPSVSVAVPAAAGPEVVVPAITTAPTAASTPGALSDADVDRIARRVVELLADKTVRDIAWEVVPEYAERLVRERIAEVERAG